MRTFLFGAMAAIGLALGFAPAKASAYWALRTTYALDPITGALLPVQQQYWVPEVIAVPTVPVVTTPVYYAVPPYRVFRRPVIVTPAPAVDVFFRFRR